MRRLPGLVGLTILLALGAESLGAPNDDPRESESVLLGRVRQLTFEGLRAGEGYFSADGSKMVFQSERDPKNPFYQIFVMDMETGDIERASPGHGKTTCAWLHPQGNRVLFASTHEDPLALKKQKDELDFRASGKERRYAWDYDENFDIYDYDPKTGSYRNLTNAKGYDAEGSWSPDGSLIAFSSNRHAYETPLSERDQKVFEVDKSFMLDLYVMNADGSNVKRLTNVKGYDGGPFFSADGKKICWRRFSENGMTAEIFTMNVDGTDERQLTRLGAMSWAPFFHPSGEYLVFTTNRHGFSNFELYIVDAEGQREPVRVTYTDGFDGLPTFTPDGKSLAWTSNRAPKSRSQIFLAPWNHEKALELLSGSGSIDVASLAVPTPSGETQAGIAEEDLRHHTTVLAAEDMDGRLTGTEGERKATEYVAGWFKKIGLEPEGDHESFYQPFPFTSGVALGENNVLLSIVGGQREMLTLAEQWTPLAISKVGSVGAGDIAFAGYGIVAPRSESMDAYDSYAGLDVKDRWVLILRFMPEDITAEQRQHLNRYSSLRYKAMIARDKGARGLILVTGPRTKVEQELVPLAFDSSMSDSGLPAVCMDRASVNALLKPSQQTLKSLQEGLDAGAPAEGFVLEGVQLAGHFELDKVEKTGRNVLGRLGSSRPREPFIVIGAHVDHLGRGGANGSLAHDDERDHIHFGADDNASGVAALIEIAEYLVGLKEQGKLELSRDIVFAAWSGEELGLLGSKHYVKHLSTKLGHEGELKGTIAACLNLDMIGRLDRSLVLSGIASSSVWPREVERRNVPVGLPISLNDDCYLPTDATSFYLAGVPILSAFTGSHSDYHSPRDTPDKLNYEGMKDITRVMALVARSLATNLDIPDFIKHEAPARKGERAGLRAYVGSIPDYGEAPIPGVLLSGVATGGPAYKAGVRGGDIIVELAGRTIQNIYDYTHAIDALKVGEPVSVVVVRDGKRRELKLTPGSRQ